MKRLLICLVIIASALGVCAQPTDRAIAVIPATVQPPGQEARVALVIGNGSYADGPLKNPVNDARAMREILASCKFDITLLTDASKRAMEDAIRAFGDKLQGGAVGLFYFAGHGLQVQGSNYLIPIGARLDKEIDVTYDGVDVGRVLDSMQAAGNKLNILILDACRNNPFALAKGWRSVGEKGLAQVKAPTGTLVAYATAPGSVAADGTGEHGIYTEALLAVLKEPGVSLLQTFQKVRQQVLDGSRGGQTPWESNSTVGDFYFRPQRTAEEIAREQGAVQAETKRLEDELKAREAQAQTAEVARQTEVLQAKLRAQELERQRLTQEADRLREVAAENSRAKAGEARRQEEASRLESLKQQLAGREGLAMGGPGVATLEGTRQALARLTAERDQILAPILAQKAEALAKVDSDYAGLRKRLEAPRDEFETTDQFQNRKREAGELQAKMHKEKSTLEDQFAELSNEQTRTIDDKISTLNVHSFLQTYKFTLEKYDADSRMYEIHIQKNNISYFKGFIRIEPDKAKELKFRQGLLRCEGIGTLSGGAEKPNKLIDPILGVLNLSEVKLVTSISDANEWARSAEAKEQGKEAASAIHDWLLLGRLCPEYIYKGNALGEYAFERVLELATLLKQYEPRREAILALYSRYPSNERYQLLLAELGLYQMKAGYLAHAEESFSILSRQSLPQARSIWENIGIIGINADRNEMALTNLNRAQAMSPSSRTSYFIGFCLMRLGRFPEAEARFHDFLAAAKANPEAPGMTLSVRRLYASCLLLQARPAYLLELMGGWPEAGTDGELAVFRAVAEIQARNWDAARDLVRDGIKLFPMKEVFRTAAQIPAADLDKKALAQLALEFMPGLWMDYARWDRGLQALEEAHKFSPLRSASLILSEVAAMLHLGQPGKALEVLRDGHRLHPTNTRIENTLGYQLLENGGDIAEARRLIEDALAGDPGNFATIDSWGWVMYKQGKLPQAEEALRKALAMRPSNPDSHMHLGEVLLKEGRLQEALTEWENVLAYEFTGQNDLELQVGKLRDLIENN